MENRLVATRSLVRLKNDQVLTREQSMQKMDEKIQQLQHWEHLLVVEGDQLGMDFTTGQVQEPLTFD